MSHWQNGLAERVRDRLQLDLRDLELSVGHEQVEFVSLQEEVGSSETGEGEQKKKEGGKKSAVRARVVVTPFLFERYLPDSMMRSLEKKWRKLQVPVYMACVIAEESVLRRLVLEQPMVRIVTVLCIKSETMLA